MLDGGMSAGVESAPLKPRSEQIRRYRFLAGLSQRELALKAGVSPAAVNRIERGHNRAIPRTMRALANALEVTIEDIAEQSDVDVA